VPALGPTTLLEAAWTLAFVYALGRSWAAYGVVSLVRKDQLARGYDEPMDLFFVRLTRFLIAGSVAGLIPGIYASAVPVSGIGRDSPLAPFVGVLVPVSLCVLAAALVGIARELTQAYERVTGPGAAVRNGDVTVVPRKPGGRRSYDREVPHG
jgi:hypothetical protein